MKTFSKKKISLISKEMEKAGSKKLNLSKVSGGSSINVTHSNIKTVTDPTVG